MSEVKEVSLGNKYLTTLNNGELFPIGRTEYLEGLSIRS